MSLLSAPTGIGKSDVFFLIACLVLADIHFLISECASANAKPHAPLWEELGRSLQPVSSIGSAAVQNTKNPSLMLSGCSSRKTYVFAEFLKSVNFRNCCHCELMSAPPLLPLFPRSPTN